MHHLEKGIEVASIPFIMLEIHYLTDNRYGQYMEFIILTFKTRSRIVHIPFHLPVKNCLVLLKITILFG